VGFLAPFALLWLIPLAGAIVFLYLLRPRRRDIVAPSVMLWQMALKETQANAPFQKLRRHLSLFLQLLIALLLVLAVARPFLWTNRLGGQATALILDGSASMKATDVPGGRFAEAIRQARLLIERKPAADAVTLVLAREKPISLTPLTSDRAKLLAALDRIRPGDVTPDMREALLFGASLVASRADAQVTVLTDGAFGRLDEIALGGPHLNFLIVGKRSVNVAITACDVRDDYTGGSGASGRQAFITVQNFDNKPITFPLELTLGGKLLDAHEITLRSGESRSEIFDRLNSDAGGILTARIDMEDDLKTDNFAYVSLAPRREIKALLVTAGNPFLERGLNADTRVIVDKVTPGAYRIEDSANHDLTVFDDIAPPADLPPGRYLFWGPKTAGSLAPVSPINAPDAEQPQILDWNRTHPLMRYVDLANVRLLRARMVTPAPWAQTLAETDAGPLIVAGERGANRSIYAGFATLESDMPLRVAFPIFLANSLQWLTARPGDSGGVLRPGDLATFAPVSGGILTVTRPDKSRDTLPAEPGKPAAYARTDASGIYSVNGGGLNSSFGVSLLSAAESNIAPVPAPAVAVTDATQEMKAKDTGTQSSLSVRSDFWSYVVLVGLVVLMLEWLAYHRRV
jgi:hypothetical protein